MKEYDNKKNIINEIYEGKGIIKEYYYDDYNLIFGNEFLLSQYEYLNGEMKGTKKNIFTMIQ